MGAINYNSVCFDFFQIVFAFESIISGEKQPRTMPEITCRIGQTKTNLMLTKTKRNKEKNENLKLN